MSDRFRDLLLLALGAGLAWLLLAGSPQPSPPAPPAPCPGPGPCPVPKPAPPPRKPWDAAIEATVGGPRHDDGTEVACELPDDLHLKNVGGSDGAGLCVFTSISHSARWQNVPLLADFRDWMRKHPGGGYPEKVDRMIAQIAREKDQPRPEYLQVEGDDLEILKLACRTGRMPGVTYGVSPTGRYGGRRIAHMVSLVAAGQGQGPDGKGWWVVLDNNYPQTYEWMSESDFRRAYTTGGAGWSVILLSPPPPPPPANR